MSTDTSQQRIRIQTWARGYKGPKRDDFYCDDQAFETVSGIGGLIHELLVFSDEGRDPLTLADLARAMIWALVGHGVTANEIHHITEEVNRIRGTAERFAIWAEVQGEILAQLQGAQNGLSAKE